MGYGVQLNCDEMLYEDMKKGDLFVLALEKKYKAVKKTVPDPMNYIVEFSEYEKAMGYIQEMKSNGYQCFYVGKGTIRKW